MELTGNPDNEEIVKLGLSVLCLKTVYSGALQKHPLGIPNWQVIDQLGVWLMGVDMGWLNRYHYC
jgi:hypothetical protein